MLFDAFLEPHLPPVSFPEHALSFSAADWENFRLGREARQAKQSEIVARSELPKFGTVVTFMDQEGRKVTFVKTLAGGHDYLGVQEGVQDFIRTSFGFV